MADTKRERDDDRGGTSKLGLWTIVVLLVLVAAFVAMLAITQTRLGGEQLRLDRFVDLAERGQIDSARILDQDAAVTGSYTRDDGTTADYNVEYLQTGLRERLVDIVIANRIPTTIDRQFFKSLRAPVTTFVGVLMLVTVFGYVALSYQRGTGLFGVFSGARRITAEDAGATFADVAGQDAAVEDIRELVSFITDAERFVALGAKVPTGLLLYGPPGCGKTLMARALAGEAGAAFFSISGSDFVEMYVGVGAARVRDLFEQARAHAPAIVFIDELDAIGRRRTSSTSGGSSEEQEQSLNQLLTEMDGFQASTGVLVVGASNRPDILDPALLRPGRFDRTVGLERPDAAGRLAILARHVTGKHLADDIDLEAIARRAVGLSGADLANVVNEGALLAARRQADTVSQGDLEVALQRILEAPERQARLSLRDRSVGHRHGGDDRVTFADVAGIDDLVDELVEIREYLAGPERFTAMGAAVPHGVLLAGPPGTGKTLLARALAGEANATFLYVAATEFVERLVGEGAARVRDLFSEAKTTAPTIVFIDEIDAIGARRSTSVDSREREHTLNQILIELDGFATTSGVIAVAATNRPDMLDPALIRPGRFDRRLTVSLPDRANRRAILALHAEGKPLADDVDLDAIAGLTTGFSGAELSNVLNEAALLAVRRNRSSITMDVIDEALERAHSGVAESGRVAEDDRRMTAYHEAGHALVGQLLPGANPPHRLTIVARGHVRGATFYRDGDDRMLGHSRSQLLDLMAEMLGGRVAEELVFDEPSASAAHDLGRVTELARRMVAEWGMTDAIGPLAYPEGTRGPYSHDAARTIDLEVRSIAEQAHARAQKVLAGQRPALDRIAAALLEHETLTAVEFGRLLDDGPVTGRAEGSTAT